MPNLGHAKLKAEWAKKHLNALEDELAAFYKSDIRRIVRHDDLEQARHVIRIEQVDPPERVGLIAGDVAHNLRSSLDHIIFALVVIGTKKLPTNRGLQWPILEKPNDNIFVMFRREGISDDCITIIKSLQPYHHGDGYKNTFFWQLHRLDSASSIVKVDWISRRAPTQPTHYSL